MQTIYALGLMELFERFWKPFTHGTILPSLVEIGRDVFHKKMF
jgi:hypothetical protein